ncbi:MAG: hypothetical protein GY936_17595 [Ignavibacteriae bacterium]|nr:hypothetical protein [Ignavibacteriota bacterium]
MWLFVGFIFTALGIIAQKEKATAFGIIFIIVGISSLIGVFFLKRIVVIIDKNTNTVERYWQTWTGILKKSKSIPIDKIQSIVYEREVGYASPVRKRGIRQHFFLLAEVNDGSEFNFFPSTYTPLSVKNNGQIIAKFQTTPSNSVRTFPLKKQELLIGHNDHN